MSRFFRLYCQVLQVFIAIALALMVLMVFGNVVLRYAFNSGINISEEMSRWLFVWVTFMGAIVALKERTHLGSDMLVSRLPVAGRRACLVAGQALMLFITWLIFSGCLEQVRINWDVQAPVSGLPVAIVYAAGLVFAISTAALLLHQMWCAVTGQLGDAELVMVTESEEAAELQKIQVTLAAGNDAALVKGKQP